MGFPAEYSWTITEPSVPAEDNSTTDITSDDAGDIALFWSREQASADIGIYQNDLAKDGGLRTAVLLSLFTNRRVDDPKLLPFGATDRAGWWGDAVPVEDGDLFGSRLWTLSREKISSDLIEKIKEYSEESLQWLIEDGVVASVKATAEIADSRQVSVEIDIERPNDADNINYRFNDIWEHV
jgi:phage gp46-like protein